jgi:hypothetical protein
MDRII